MLHNRHRGVSSAAAALAALLILAAGGLAAQSGRAVTRVQENLRAEPNGVVVAVVEPGMEMRLVRQRQRWAEVVVEGWIWEASLRARDGGNFDFQVSEAEGENLRAVPQGEVLARMEEGALLVELDRQPGWVRVRRQAWMWAPSLEILEGSGDTDAGAAAGDRPSAGRSAPASLGVYRPGSGAPVLNAPDGDTLALLEGGNELAVTGRQGNWARVRIDGWVWMPPGQGVAEGDAEPALEGAVSPSLGDVLGNPEGFVGRLVTWTVQFVSLEQAEAVRTDFYEGEPFLLTRPTEGGATTRFVYVAVPPEFMAEAEGLVPLDRVTVVGRIRTGASSLTGAPILDLVELRRAP